jgi:hypothetical protein
MDNPGIQLFINVCFALIVLIIARIALKEWDRRAKAKEAAEAKVAEAKKTTKPKKK